MALTPGPNMICLITRSIMQGCLAAFSSLLGVILGFVFYMPRAESIRQVLNKMGAQAEDPI